MSTAPLEQLQSLAAAYRDDPERVPGYAAMSGRVPRPEGMEPRRAAVLVLLGALDSTPAEHHSPAVPAELDLLLVLRAAGLRDHAGEIAFPGGGVEAGDDGLVGTALREAQEETGLDPAGVRVLGALPRVQTVSRFSVTPVLGWWERQRTVGVVDIGESAEVFRTPVADLLDPSRRCVTPVRHGGTTFRLPAFELPQGLLWGFTAGIVDALFDELGWTEPWDRRREVRPPGR